MSEWVGRRIRQRFGTQADLQLAIVVAWPAFLTALALDYLVEG